MLLVVSTPLMKILSFFLLFVVCLSAQTNDVTQYGAVPDGKTDSTAAIKKAFAAAKQGYEIDFPCGPKGSNYLVTQPLDLPGMVTLAGSQGDSCSITYQSNSSNDAAYTLVNERLTTIRNIALLTSAEGVAPDAILMLGGVHGKNGQHLFDNITIGGYAKTAMVYSISSENNLYRHVFFSFQGGGAGIGFYTSSKDDFHICSACVDASNLSVTLQDSTFQASVTTPFTAIEDKTEGGTGDHQYRDGLIDVGPNPESSGFTFVSADTTHLGPNGHIIVSGFRMNDGGLGFHFVQDHQNAIFNLDISGVTWQSSVIGAVGFMEGVTGLSLNNCRFVKNVALNNSNPATSSVDQLQNSVVMEDYGAITIRTKAIGDYFLLTGVGSVILPPKTAATANLIERPN